ncbi:hypothetical protein [Jeotgalibacillus proteolyticus]|uniref:hypothetical protein n=1 Tax=Jeotgalibacillus proteolyticus TaxID=2082395 RepID=UPI003CE6F373
MSKKFKAVSVVILSMSLFITASWIINNENEIPVVSGQGEISENYSSTNDMEKDSILTIKGKVIEQETLVYGNLPFTISDVKIIQSYKGKHVKGDVIQVVETGGIYHPEGKNGDKLDKVEMRLNGVATLNEKDNVILFLDNFIGPQIENGYIPLGAYQGRFKSDINGNLKQLTSEGNEITNIEQQKISSFEEKLESTKQ